MATLGVNITGNERDLLRAFKSSERGSRQFRREIGRTNREVSRFGRGAFAALPGASGLGQSVGFAAGLTAATAAVVTLKTAFSELAQQQKVAAQTNAVIKSTGQIAGVTAKHVADLGNSLLHLSGVDDEAIKSGENLLLTFTNIRNVVGKGNDVFDQTTKAVLDMSVAMGQDLQTTVIQVGKALQDPIKGATSLRRVGVALTEQQQKQIKTLVKNNRLLDAQKIILRELTTEFGGSAAALGRTPIGKVDKLRETFANFAAEVVAGNRNGVVPLVDNLQAWLDKDENLVRVQKDVNAVVNTTVLFVQDLATAIDAIHDAVVTIKVNVVKGSTPGLKLLDLLGKQFEPVLTQRLKDLFKKSPNAPRILGPTGAAPKQFIPSGTQGLRVAPQGAVAPGSGSVAAGRGGVTQAQRNAFFDAAIGRRLDRVQDVRTLRGQITTLTTIAGLVSRRLRLTKDITRRFTLEDELLGIARQQKSLRAEIADNQVEAKRLAAEKKLAALEKERERVQRARANRLAALGALQRGQERGRAQTTAKQFAALGLGPTGSERVPTADQLRKQLGTVEKAFKGTVLDTAANRKTLQGVRKDLSGELGKLNADVRAKIKELLDALTPDKAVLEGTLFHKTSPNEILKGLGLSADETRSLRGRLSRVGVGGTTAGRGGGAFGVPDTQIVVPVSIDGWQVAKVVTKRQQTRTRRNPPQKRGPNAGR